MEAPTEFECPCGKKLPLDIYDANNLKKHTSAIALHMSICQEIRDKAKAEGFSGKTADPLVLAEALYNHYSELLKLLVEKW